MKKLLRTRRFIIAALVVVIGAPTAWLLARDSAGSDSAIVATVKRGEFKVMVTTAGELRALKFVQITGPANMQAANAYQVKIASIVPEGTVVKAGDVVADLDRSTLASSMADVSLALAKAQAVYEQAMLDSTLNLSKAREDMKTLDLTLDEQKIAKEQASYEAPSVKRQADISLEKATRALAQAKLDYKTKTEQAEAKMREVGADLDRQKNKLKIIQDVMEQFTIKAPSSGMVIYMKDWNGKKRVVGSQVTAWDPNVATLPDLSHMESVTYVNEIDVRKLVVGQPVTLTLDADANKKLTGKVVQIANVGEQRPNSDAKVFEVHIEVAQADTTLRPGMTTGNGIQTFRVKEALYLPLEAVSSEQGVPFVYRKSGSGVTKQEVETGAMNDDQVVIVRGLVVDDKVLVSPPANRDKLQVIRLPGSTSGLARPVLGDTANTAAKSVPVEVKPPAAKAGGAAAAPISKKQ
jgi:RND family efflux transporter MFP subunit